MPRQDIWDVQNSDNDHAADCGFERGLQDAYSLGAIIGKGGFGRVYECTQNATGHVRALFPARSRAAAAAVIDL